MKEELTKLLRYEDPKKWTRNKTDKLPKCQRLPETGGKGTSHNHKTSHKEDQKIILRCKGLVSRVLNIEIRFEEMTQGMYIRCNDRHIGCP